MAGSGWEAMWARGLSKGAAFDAARAEPALVSLLQKVKLPLGRALVPGCGRGYSVAALAAPDRTSLGLDIAPTGVAAARECLAEMLRGSDLEKQANVEQANFFDITPELLGGQFNLIYDCTFLCAIQPAQREMWASQMNKLLAPAGELITLIFPVGPIGDRGPPFSINEELVRSLLTPHGFNAISVEEVPRDQQARGGKEIIARWTRA